MHKLFKSKNLIVALTFVAAMALSTVAAHAQLVGELQANIPFAFSADNTRMPAGEYYIRPVEDVGGPILEIESLNKNMAVLVMPENSQSTQLPKTSELTFDKIGNQYFLREIVVQDSQLGYTLAQPKAEAKLKKGSAQVERHRLTIKHHKTRVSKP